MKRHLENPGVVTTVYSAIFRHIQGHSVIFGPLSDILRDSKVYSGIIYVIDDELYLHIFGTIFNPCIYNQIQNPKNENPARFRTLQYSEFWHIQDARTYSGISNNDSYNNINFLFYGFYTLFNET